MGLCAVITCLERLQLSLADDLDGKAHAGRPGRIIELPMASMRLTLVLHALEAAGSAGVNCRQWQMRIERLKQAGLALRAEAGEAEGY